MALLGFYSDLLGLASSPFSTIFSRMMHEVLKGNMAIIARPRLRLGFSTSQSSLLMGHGSTDVCFDMEGGRQDGGKVEIAEGQSVLDWIVKVHIR